MTAQRDAAINLLSRMLTGITMTSRTPDSPSGEPVPDLGADKIDLYGDHGIETVLTLPTGDRYRVIVDWIKEESP